MDDIVSEIEVKTEKIKKVNNIEKNETQIKKLKKKITNTEIKLNQIEDLINTESIKSTEDIKTELTINTPNITEEIEIITIQSNMEKVKELQQQIESCTFEESIEIYKKIAELINSTKKYLIEQQLNIINL